MRALLRSLRTRLDGSHRRAWRAAPIHPRPALTPEQLAACRAEEFPAGLPQPWLDADDAEARIAARLRAGELTAEQAAQCRAWRRDGYVIVRGLFDDAVLDPLWRAYQAVIDAGRINPPPEPVAPDDVLPGRSLNPHLQVPEVAGVMHAPALLDWIEVLLGCPARPFQSIFSHKGSQQREHSDSIHMTTYPLGFLAAAWVAFEDIHPDSGPLVYYPGSHREPYLLRREVGIGADSFKTKGYRDYVDRYEPRIQRLICERQLAPSHFLARKGDVLIWHANLLHGGSKRRDVRLSRRALVCHYFGAGAFAYHDLSAAPCSFGAAPAANSGYA